MHGNGATLTLPIHTMRTRLTTHPPLFCAADPLVTLRIGAGPTRRGGLTRALATPTSVSVSPELVPEAALNCRPPVLLPTAADSQRTKQPWTAHRRHRPGSRGRRERFSITGSLPPTTAPAAASAAATRHDHQSQVAGRKVPGPLARARETRSQPWRIKKKRYASTGLGEVKNSVTARPPRATSWLPRAKRL